LGEARGSETLHDLSEEEISDKLRIAVRRANRAVIHRASDHPELQGMGTTMTLAFIRDNRVLVAHVGDSRAYLVDGREGWINQITDDHSFVEALLTSGHITAEQAAVHPMRNVLYRALGQVEDTESDLYSRTLAEGDRLILCSDGLTRHVSAAELAEIAMQYDDPEDIAQRLIDLANQRGGEDNISVVAIIMESAKDIEPEEPPNPIVFDETDIGLYQAVPPEEVEPEQQTLELPAVEPDDLPDERGER
jgi:protein phosphatase